MANDNFDLPRPTDAVPSATSAVGNDNFKVLDYVVNGEGTVINRVGDELLTLDEALSRINWAYVGLFADGVTFTSKTDFAVDAVGTQWAYNGPYPFTATAGTVPSSPGYQAVHVSSHSALSGINDAGGHDSIYTRVFSSVDEIKALNSIDSDYVDASDLIIKTTSYYGSYDETKIPTGGSQYIATTLQRVRDSKADPSWVPDGNKDFYINGGVVYVALSCHDMVTPSQCGWTADKAGPDLIASSIESGVQFTQPKKLTSLRDAAAAWASGLGFSIAMYGDSTVDGRTTTLDGINPATVYNTDRLVGGNVPDGLVYDHDDTEQPNAWPNIAQRLIREYYSNTSMRIYNAGYRGEAAEDGWASLNIYNAVYGNTTYQPNLKMVGFNFGLNDVVSEPDNELLREKFTRYSEAMALDAFARGIQPFFVACNFNSDTGRGLRDNAEVVDIIESIKLDLCKKYNLEYIDFNGLMKQYAYTNSDAVQYNDFADDAVHYNDLGHIKQAEWFLTYCAGSQIPVVTTPNRFDVSHSALRYNRPYADVASPGNSRGLNMLATHGLLTDAELLTEAGNTLVDFYLFNELPDAILAYNSFSAAGADFTSIVDPAKVPQLEVSTLNGSAADFYKTDEFNSQMPDYAGNVTDSSPDRAYVVCRLKYGLNRVAISVPSDVADEIANSYSSGTNYFGYLSVHDGSSKFERPVMQHSVGLEEWDVAPYANLGAPMIAPVKAPSGTHPSNRVTNLRPPAKDLLNNISLSKAGDYYEWRFRGSFEESTGMVLAWNAFDNVVSSIPVSDRDKQYQSGNIMMIYRGGGTFSLAKVRSTGALATVLSTGVSAITYADKFLTVRITRDSISQFTFELFDENLTLLYTSPFSTGINELSAGVTGGTFSTATAQTLPLIIKNLQVRQVLS